MSAISILAAIKPFVDLGSEHSPLLNWLLSLVILAITVSFIVWLVSKFAGPPNIPEPFRWIIWVIVAIVLLIIICAAFGVAI
jgi:hypothetical protein